MIRNLRFLLAAAGLTLAFPLTACGDDSDDGDTGASDSVDGTTSASSTGAETEAGSTAASATASASESATATESASASASESASASASETGTSTTTGGADTGSDSGGSNAACEPDADDDECSMCLKTSCCDQLQACRDDSDCNCIIDCLDEMGTGIAGLPECQTECEVKMLPKAAIPLSGCQNTCAACSE